MSATPTPAPLLRIEDPLTGLPLVGGKVFFYITGTTTPLDTWADAAKVGLNTNPVILGADGSAPIFLDGNYKVVVTRADNTAVWTVDGVVGGTSFFDKPASGITSLAFDDIASTNVQAALQELGSKRVKSTATIDLLHGGTGQSVATIPLLLTAFGFSAYVQTLLAAANAEAERNLLLIPSIMLGYLFGNTLSNNVGTPASKIDIAAGVCTDSTGVRSMVGAAITKDLAVAWAVGNAGGLDTGAVGNNTYHVFRIERTDTGVVDALFSLSPTAPTMPSPYTLFRRIGSITRVAGVIVAFVQNGDDFQFTNTPNDVSAVNPGTAAVTATLSVPTGIIVTAWVAAALNNQSATPSTMWLSALDAADETPTTSGHAIIEDVANTGASRMSGWGNIKTNASGQIRYRVNFSSGGTTVTLTTRGWTDNRGRLA